MLQKSAELYTRVIVYGGRNYNDKNYAFSVLSGLKSHFHPYMILGSGGAKGADSLGELWAIENQYDLIRLPIKSWEWTKYGKGAGRMRNERLFKLMKPDFGIMFPGGAGTAHMSSLFHNAHTPYWDATKNQKIG